jgi:hypothetical protein
MEITAEIIAGIKYSRHLKCNLPVVSLENFDVNSAKSSCLISDNQNRLAASKWVSRKRTRVDKITNQKFNNEFVLNKIKEIADGAREKFIRRSAGK